MDNTFMTQVSQFIWHRLLVCMLALLPANVWSQTPDKSIQIQDVRIGFPAGSSDMYKDGKWVPVLVTLGPPREANSLPASFQGQLEISTKDSDGWNTHILKENVLLARENTRGVFQSYIKVSDASSYHGVIVRLKGKLGATEINQTFSYPPNERMRADTRNQVDHESILAVNVGSSHGLKASDDAEEFNQNSSRNAQRLMSIRAASPNMLSELPDRWYGYEGVDAIILATGGNFGSSLVQQLARDTVRSEALEQWVLQGGHLIVSVAGNAGIVGSPTDFPLERLLPVKIDRSGAEKAERLDGLRDFIVQSLAQNLRRSQGEIRGPLMPYARLEPKPGIKTLTASLVSDVATYKKPLIVRSAYGLGKITVIGFDTNDAAFQNWENKSDFWSSVMEARAITPSQNQYYGAPRDDASLSLANRIEEFGDVPVISFAVVALFIALYIILIGPVDYFVLKKVFKRLEYTWITFPTVVLLVSLAAYFGAYYLKGDKLRLNKVDLIDIDLNRERIMGSTWMAIFSPRLQNYNVDLTPQSVSSPATTLSWLGRYSVYSGSRMVGQSQGGLFERDYEYTPAADGIRQLPIQVWSQKSLEARWLGSIDRAKQPFESKLVKERLYIKGSVRSRLPVKLLGAKLFYADKTWTVGDMDPDKDYDIEFLNQGSTGVMSGSILSRKLAMSSQNTDQPDFAPDMNSLIFASRDGSGNTKTSEYLRHLNQTWRLKDYGEAILVGTLADEYGDAAKLNQGGVLGTKLKLTNPSGADLLTGSMRQATFIRVFLPVKESPTAQ